MWLLAQYKAFKDLIKLVFDKFTKCYCRIIDTSDEDRYVTKLSKFVSIVKRLDFMVFLLMNIM